MKQSNIRSSQGANPTIEKWLVEQWNELFNIKSVDLNSDFFDLGGNSLTAIKFLAKVEEIYGEETLLPDALFTNGNLKHIAASIAAKINEQEFYAS